MKLTLESYGNTYSVEMHDDSNVEKTVRAWVSLMISASYQPENITELFVDGNPMDWDVWSV